MDEAAIFLLIFNFYVAKPLISVCITITFSITLRELVPSDDGVTVINAFMRYVRNLLSSQRGTWRVHLKLVSFWSSVRGFTVIVNDLDSHIALCLT